MDEALRFSQSHGVRAGCQALDLPPSSLYREKLRRERPALDPRPRAASPRALSPPRKGSRCGGPAQPTVYRQSSCRRMGELLDEGRYLCSIRTMYRILAKRLEVRERRRQRRHPQYSKPELLATGPNQCWSWDITKLKGPVKWSYYYLYVIWTSSAAMWWAGWWPPRKAPAWPSLDRPELLQAGDRSGWSHPACRSWLVDEFQSTGLATGRSGSHQVSLSASCL